MSVKDSRTTAVRYSGKVKCQSPQNKCLCTVEQYKEDEKQKSVDDGVASEWRSLDGETHLRRRRCLVSWLVEQAVETRATGAQPYVTDYF